MLDRVSAWRGFPEKMRMDNGPELISVTLADWAERNGVELEFIQPGKPTQNSYIERFNKTFSNEGLDFYLFSTLSEVKHIHPKKTLLTDGTNLGRFTNGRSHALL